MSREHPTNETPEYICTCDGDDCKICYPSGHKEYREELTKRIAAPPPVPLDPREWLRDNRPDVPPEQFLSTADMLESYASQVNSVTLEVLAKHCRGFGDKPITVNNLPELLNNICESDYRKSARIIELEGERDEARLELEKLKLSTTSELWWLDDSKFDSPENYAEECELKIGDEFKLQGARYRDEVFRVKKVADETSDDWECEEITKPDPHEYDTYFSMKTAKELAESQLSTTRDALRKIWDVIDAPMDNGGDWEQQYWTRLRKVRKIIEAERVLAPPTTKENENEGR